MSQKYFRTGNAVRKYKKDGIVVEFEPLVFEQGSWIGALSLDEESREARMLADFGPPVTEITAVEYDQLKKKPSSSSTSSSVMPEEPETTEEESPSKANHVAASLEDEIGYGTPGDREVETDEPEVTGGTDEPETDEEGEDPFEGLGLGEEEEK